MTAAGDDDVPDRDDAPDAALARSPKRNVAATVERVEEQGGEDHVVEQVAVRARERQHGRPALPAGRARSSACPSARAVPAAAKKRPSRAIAYETRAPERTRPFTQPKVDTRIATAITSAPGRTDDAPPWRRCRRGRASAWAMPRASGIGAVGRAERGQHDEVGEGRGEVEHDDERRAGDERAPDRALRARAPPRRRR